METKRRTFNPWFWIPIVILVLIAGIVLAKPMHRFLFREAMSNGLNNARQLQLATMTMSLDAFTKGEGPSWTMHDKTGRVITLDEFGHNLIASGYLRNHDLFRLLSCQGIQASFPLSQANTALRIYPICEADPPNAIFITSANWTPYLPLKPQAKPYGDTGFLVMHKGGDGAFYQARQATNTITGLLTTNAGGVPLK